MERLSRKERRAIQAARDRARREREQPVEFACCGACDYLIRVYLGEDGPMPESLGLEITHLPIGDLRPDPGNPRRISNEELESLTRSRAD